MKFSDIITHIMKITGFDFKRIRSSSFRDIQKSAKSQDFEYSCAQTGVEKAGWFFKIARMKIHQTFLASKYDIKQHSEATQD